MDTPIVIDTDEFTRLGESLSGQLPLAQFKRALSGQPAQGAGLVDWSIKGETRHGQRFLEMHVKATPLVECQRCLQAMPCPIASSSRLLVVDTQEELEIEDDPEAAPQDWLEPILASRRLDVFELLEDELVLALPYVPMHQKCSTQALDEAQRSPVDEPSPFAKLTKLKKH